MLSGNGLKKQLQVNRKTERLLMKLRREFAAKRAGKFSFLECRIADHHGCLWKMEIANEINGFVGRFEGRNSKRANTRDAINLKMVAKSPPSPRPSSPGEGETLPALGRWPAMGTNKRPSSEWRGWVSWFWRGFGRVFSILFLV